MNLRFIDWIWHVRGSVPLAAEQSRDEAFDRLSPLFREKNTTHEQTADGALTFTKKDQAAQDKMSVFDGGVLKIEEGAGGAVLRFDLTSRALLFCFLAPLLFLAFAQATIVVGKWKAAEASAKKEEKKDKEKVYALNPIDKFLGAPAPEKPKKDAKDGKDGKEKGGKKPSPTPAYVFAGLFAALYVVGRILEDRLVKGLFKKKLLGA